MRDALTQQAGSHVLHEPVGPAKHELRVDWNPESGQLVGTQAPFRFSAVVHEDTRPDAREQLHDLGGVGHVSAGGGAV